MTGALAVQASGLRLPLRDGCVDLIITSFPYFALRAYDTGYPDLEVGSESTPQLFLEAVWAATAEMVRVLKPSGSMFIDLGDKYSTGNSGDRNNGLNERWGNASGKNVQLVSQQRSPAVQGMPAKSLLLLPERYRIGCVDRLGLIARSVTIWNKPNGLPESVTDRVRRSHEDWVHLVKQPRYYSAIDEVREPHDHRSNQPGRGSYQASQRPDGVRARFATPNGNTAYNPLGKLPGSVWTIPSEPLNLPGYFVAQDGQLLDFLAPTRGGRRSPRPNGHHPGLFDPDPYAELIVGEDANAWRWMRSTGITSSPWPKTDAGLQLHTGADHYAAFPTRWPEQLIKGFSPPGICLDCGQGRVPVVDREREQTRKGTDAIRGPNDGSVIPQSGGNGFGQRAETTATILGYACSCTPYTDHPGSEEKHADDRYGNALARGEGYPATFPNSPAGGNSSLTNRPKLGPWREYHLDRWIPPPTRPAIILDPFGGTGTTAMVARALGRIGLSFDLSHAYSRAARWRIWSDDAAKAISRTNLERQGQLL